ncbi:hypothetical protein Rhe02_56280 [Rhizocola hellebori]|uniref:Sensor domain-containing protein n=1 Tax=Rhizocola hellebori TaxID=1392758 RepID=A0A8J3QBJ7_9ACTN|nr:hypothetical protein [Rhizocola hellebori]GIH07561.1 hypothetical protein Rhe02_56280 [Rhizocola hellebori]
MTSVPRQRAALALAALAISSVAGCSAASAPAKTPPAADTLIPVSAPSVSAVPTLDTVRGLNLPTEEYRPSEAQRNVIADAVRLKTAECMSQFGFGWATGTAHLPAPNQVDRLYGVSDLPTAQQRGYHLPANSRKAGESRPEAVLSQAERLVLGGDPSGTYQGKPIPVGGCTAQARRLTLGVDDIDPTRLADTITVGMWERSKADPRVVAVVAAWSECMKQLGYKYSSPLDAGGDHPEWLRAADPSAAEIRTAVDDVRCKQRTNVIGVWFTVESGYENAAIQLHLDELTQIKLQWEQAAARAAHIVPD